MNVLGGVHHLQTELVFVQSDAFDLVPVWGHDGDGLIFLRKLLRRFREPPSQPLAGSANRLDQRIYGSRRAHSSQVGAEASSIAFDHVTRGTVGITVKKFLAMRSVAN